MEKNAPSSFSNPQSSQANASENNKQSGYTTLSIPQIKLPKGGGAIKSIDEKFSVNGVNGTAGFSIPFPFSPSRNDFMPSMALSYNSGSGNGIFGLGWDAEPPAIVRRTDKKLPQYLDDDESDTFIFSGAEDLVPVYIKDTSGNWHKDTIVTGSQTITRYRPRIEGGFARIEKITEANGDVYWKTTSAANVVSVFGKSKTAQVVDPTDSTKIFKWLLEFSYDDKGNCFQLAYKQEDATNVQAVLHEKNRLNHTAPCTNTYIKHIKYGNKIHFNSTAINFADWDNFLNTIEYLLELVIDYGEHDLANPQPGDDNGWQCRTDPFSHYRAGFDIRTYRLCRRVLMFHHFEELGSQPCLVRAMEMEYDTGAAFTFLKAITQKGYIRKPDGTYSEKAMPPATFTYQPLGWDTTIHTLPDNSMDNLPAGIDGAMYQWIDLYKEGVSGILTEQAGAWYYKGNAGDGQFDGMQLVASKPAVNGLSGMWQLQEIEANGRQFLVSYDAQGFYELDDNSEWLPFRNFSRSPNINWRDPNLRFIDLNGDGMADILIAEDQVFTWYAAKGKEGFESHRHTTKSFDEEKGPNIVFADGTEFIALADMNGDGLSDILRVRNGEVVYWPNLGYGKFGAMITMSEAPVFDRPGHFNIQYLKLADLDGSGTTDILYLGKDSCTVYFNQSGNGFSTANIVNGINPLPFPKIDPYASIQVIDLLGNGTGCLVWSSVLPQHAGVQLRYIDLMGGKKPHVMNAFKNNMGKEVFIEYTPSTFFYLEDKKAGTPWITKLPFPVQCVSKVIAIDQVSKTRFTNQYTYHHGYFDMMEREFRGFGRVEQTDTEYFEQYKKLSHPGGSIQLVNEDFHQPPVLTKTWFHTGAFLDKEKIFTQFAHEYYSNPFIEEHRLQEPPIPPDWTVDEWREALRACKGLPLHMEVYSPDGSELQQHPYTTASHSCLVQMLQPKGLNPYAVFLVQQNEQLVYAYERNPADPHIAHSMIIETDAFGNVLKTAAISYGRKITDAGLTPEEQAEQNKIHIIFSENKVSNIIDDATGYHLPVPYETTTWELTGLMPTAGDYFSITEIKNAFEQAVTIAYEATPTISITERRLVEKAGALFLKNDLSGPLPFGVIESLVLPYQSYNLAFTPALLEHIFGDKVSEALLLNEGKYSHFNDANYWITSGTQTFDATHFYQVTEIIDPFGFKTQITHDNGYHFFVQQVTDALGNQSRVAGFNFRILSPYLMLDINDNRSGVRTDELGMVTASFVMGKENENKGDWMDTSSVEAVASDQPGSILEYDLFNYLNTGKPVFSKTTTRETHHFDNLATGDPVIWQTGYEYLCGDGSTIMRKVQAEPGIALQENADGTITEVNTSPNLRWIGNGRVILNNKGQTVKQYEPYFSTTFEFEDAKELVERGVTPVMYYDSAGRLIKTELPDGTFTKVEFDAWRQRTFDQNDTVLDSQWYKDRILAPVPAIATPEEVAAAIKAAAHANTPVVTYLDSLGRNFLTIADNGAVGKYKTITAIDVEGNILHITDARSNRVMQYKYDMLGASLYNNSMDAGEVWIINDVMGKPLRTFNSRNHTIRYEYDTLHRPLKLFMQQDNEPEINTERLLYAESLPEAKTNNLLGKAYRQYDAAGVVVTVQIDFKGNLLQGHRQLLLNYKDIADWNILTDADLESTVYTTAGSFDALNRPRLIHLHDNNTIRMVYNEAGILNEVFAGVQGAAEKQFVKDISYDAKGQRQFILYGNDTKTSYRYHPKNLRLTQLLTTGSNGTDLLQQLRYTYDPAGNITSLSDQAQQTLFFNNTVVDPSAEYTYDALYRLIMATGREHIGQNRPPSAFDEFRTNLPMPGDGAAMRNYSQLYEYDAVGNILQLTHAAGAGSYTRTYNYQTVNNRLTSTSIGSTTENYTYDEHGNIGTLNHLQSLVWNYKDQLQQIDLGGGGVAYYVYDNGGQRIRKVIERPGGIKEQQLYLGGFELYHKIDGGGIIQTATETLHVMDDASRIAMVETKTIEQGVATSSTPLIRYQYSDHIGSSSLELDEHGVIISYEEYHPYGTTAYQAMNAALQAAAKRYRYTGMERDEESGLEYHNARYYLPWLGRWLSADPISIQGGLNVYEYCKGNPVNLRDASGNAPDDEQSLVVIPNGGQGYDPNDADDPNATVVNQVVSELGGWDAAGELTDFEQNIVAARSGGNFTWTGPPGGLKITVYDVYENVGQLITKDQLAKALVLRLTKDGVSTYGWLTEEAHAYIIWSREGKLLDAFDNGKGYSMTPGLGASLLNPIDLLSGAAAAKVLGKGGAAAATRIADALAASSSKEVAVSAAAKLAGGGKALAGALADDVAAGAAKEAAPSALRKGWLAWWGDKGGQTNPLTYGAPYTGWLSWANRLKLKQGWTTSIVNKDAQLGSGWAARVDTAAHEGFHGLVLKYLPSVFHAGAFKLKGIPIGAPVLYLHEVAAYSVGRIASLRLHALPFAPIDALASLSAGQLKFTLSAFLVGGGGVGAYYLYKHMK